VNFERERGLDRIERSEDRYPEERERMDETVKVYERECVMIPPEEIQRACRRDGVEMERKEGKVGF
jgi:hypothetical protein